MHDDWQIIERILSGDTGMFRWLVDAHQPLVFQFVRNMLRNLEDAEDLTQEVFVAAFRNLSAFDATKAKFSTWLLTIARNRCCNQLKRPQIAKEEASDLVDRQPLPDIEASRREVWQHLDVALEMLPLDQRTAFVLAEIQELPHAEIAEIEGIELGTVKSRVSRAKERLRQAMKAWQPETSQPPGSHP